MPTFIFSAQLPILQIDQAFMLTLRNVAHSEVGYMVTKCLVTH